MKRNTFSALFLFLMATFLLTACNSAAQEEASLQMQEEVKAVPIEVTEVETGDIALVTDYTGNIVAKSSVNILPVAGGRIDKVLVEVGNVVKEGDPIAIVESDVYEARLKQARAALESAKINLAKMEQGARPEQIAATQAAVELARASLEDMTTLSDDEKAVALASIAQARAGVNGMTDISDDQRTVAASNLARAEAGLRLAQYEYDKISWAGQVGMTPQALQLQQATIAYETALAAYNLQVNPNEHRLSAAEAALSAAEAGYNLRANPSDAQLAPLLGQIVQAELALALAEKPFTDLDFDLVRQGIKQAEAAVEMATIQLDEAIIRAPLDGIVAEVYITKGQMVGPQAPAAMVVSEDMEVTINIEESYIAHIVKGQNAALRVSAYDEDFPGLVTSIAPVADSKTHTFAVKITPTNGSGQLRSGMFANVAILADERTGVLLISRSAVTLVDGEEVVYVVSGNTVEQRAVSTGLFDKERIEIKSGLEAGETVVIAGQPNLQNGSEVQVMNN